MRRSIRPDSAALRAPPSRTIQFAEGTNDLVRSGLPSCWVIRWPPTILRESYVEGETFSNAYAKLYACIFGDHGLVLLDPADA